MRPRRLELREPESSPPHMCGIWPEGAFVETPRDRCLSDRLGMGTAATERQSSQGSAESLHNPKPDTHVMFRRRVAGRPITSVDGTFGFFALRSHADSVVDQPMPLPHAAGILIRSPMPHPAGATLARSQAGFEASSGHKEVPVLPSTLAERACTACIALPCGARFSASHAGTARGVAASGVSAHRPERLIASSRGMHRTHSHCFLSSYDSLLRQMGLICGTHSGPTLRPHTGEIAAPSQNVYTPGPDSGHALGAPSRGAPVASSRGTRSPP